jgi:hypothetical protein
VVVVVVVVGRQQVEVIVISTGSGEDFVPRLLIVKLALTGCPHSWFFPPRVEEVLLVNSCVTCVCGFVYIFCYIAIG